MRNINIEYDRSKMESTHEYIHLFRVMYIECTRGCLGVFVSVAVRACVLNVRQKQCEQSIAWVAVVMTR